MKFHKFTKLLHCDGKKNNWSILKTYWKTGWPILWRSCNDYGSHRRCREVECPPLVSEIVCSIRTHITQISFDTSICGGDIIEYKALIIYYSAMRRRLIDRFWRLFKKLDEQFYEEVVTSMVVIGGAVGRVPTSCTRNRVFNFRSDHLRFTSTLQLFVTTLSSNFLLT